MTEEEKSSVTELAKLLERLTDAEKHDVSVFAQGVYAGARARELEKR